MANTCFICGEDKVIWGNDFTFDDLGMDGEGIVHFYSCMNCGTEYEVYEHLHEEEEE